ncbi:aminotransferase class IV family protein [soil metagenome]
MSRLIETIRLLDGQFHNLDYHQQRVTRAFRDLLKLPGTLDLSKILIKDVPAKGLFKCRLLYHKSVESLTFTPYTIRYVKSLRMVIHDTIDYGHKFEDRNVLNELFEQRDSCDDVLIIKKGMVTDASYSNILLKKKSEWFTPASCLLQGTMRQRLIDDGRLRIEEIKAGDIVDFDKFKLINSMLLDQGPETDVTSIVR